MANAGTDSPTPLPARQDVVTLSPVSTPARPSESQQRTIRWGIAGPGRIADRQATDFPLVPDAELAAVASRSYDRAARFAQRHGVPSAYGSYGDLVGDPDIDAVYITTPHPQHLAIARAAFRSGKAVLVEKTFTATVTGAEELVALSQECGTFAMEAMWTRFLPNYVAIRELIADGAIGQVRQVQADLGVDRAYDPSDRAYDLAQGGGAMLDLGVYLISVAQHLMSTPDTLQVTGARTPEGVDAEFGLLLGYDDGRSATLLGSIQYATPGAANVIGTQGWIEIPPRFHHPASFVLHRPGHDPENIARPPLGAGYPHQFIEVGNRIRAGETQSPVMPLADTLAVQRLLNQACEQLGVWHREDESVDVAPTANATGAAGAGDAEAGDHAR